MRRSSDCIIYIYKLNNEALTAVIVSITAVFGVSDLSDRGRICYMNRGTRNG